MKQPMDHLRGKKKPVSKTVWIAGDSLLAEELSELEADLSREKSSLTTMRNENPRREAALQTVADLEQKVSEKRAEMREASIKFVFRALSQRRYEELLQEHPPTEEQQAEFKASGDSLPFNPETFPRALIVECCVEPDTDKAELEEWLRGDDWNQAEIMSLFMAATEVNSTRHIVNMGKG
jgi:hypothetical protein